MTVLAKDQLPEVASDVHVTLEINLFKPQLSKKPCLLWDGIFYVWQGAAPKKSQQYSLVTKTQTVKIPVDISEWGKYRKRPPLAL